MRVVIAGAGEVGYFLAKRFSETTNRVLLVDSVKEYIDEADEDLDAMTLVGNITHHNLLQHIDCHETDLFLAVTGSDSVNIVAASRAKKLGAKIVIARVDDPEYYPAGIHIINHEFGLDAIICTSRILGLEILRKILCLNSCQIYEFSGFGLSILHHPIKEGSKFENAPIKNLKPHGSCKIRGVIRNNLFRDIATIQKLSTNDEIIISGTINDLFLFTRENFRQDEDSKAIVVGGGDVGLQLTKYLEEFEEKTELLEISKKRCLEIAAVLKRASVIHGSGVDLDLLKDLNLNSNDYVVAVTGNDQTNIMCSLIAKGMGAGFCIARLNQSGYENVVDHLSVGETAFTHESTFNLAMSFLSTATTNKHIRTETSHDYYELKVPEIKRGEFRLVDLELPALVTIMGVVRNFHPIDFDVPIKEGDNLIFSGPSNTIKYTIKSIRSLCKK